MFYSMAFSSLHFFFFLPVIMVVVYLQLFSSTYHIFLRKHHIKPGKMIIQVEILDTNVILES